MKEIPPGTFKVRKTAFTLFFSSAALLLGACSTMRTTPETIRGSYEYRPGPKYYAGESFHLHKDNTFEAGLFTDNLADPRLKHFPAHGRYQLRGCLITFQNSLIDPPNRLLLRRAGRFTMWTPEEYEEFLRTRRTPDSVLYQQKPK